MNYSNQANYFWFKKKKRAGYDVELKHGAFEGDITS